jgi:hypothetical protein
MISEGQCCAFGKDHRRCRLASLPETNTCYVHKFYYINWFNSHPGFFSLNFISKRQLKEYIFQFRNRYVTLPVAHVTSIPANWYDYYNTIIMYTDHCPLVNRACLRNVVNIIVRGAFVPIAPGQFDESVYEDLRFFLKSPEACAVVFHELVQAGLDLLRWGWRNVPRTVDVIHSIYSKFFALEEWRYIACGSSLIKLFKNALTPMDRFDHFVRTTFHPAFVGAIRELKQTHRSHMKNRVAVFREELVAQVFHPDRMQQLIDTYGIDVLDTL